MISTKVYSRESFKVILFLLFCLPLTISYFYFFSCSRYHSSYFLFFCYPSLFLNYVYHLIALQQQFFAASGMGTSYLNILLTSYHHQKNAQHYTETTLRRKEKTKGRTKSMWSTTSTKIVSSVSSFIFCSIVYRSNRNYIACVLSYQHIFRIINIPPKTICIMSKYRGEV